MGAIARNAANKITTGGVFTSGAITNTHRVTALYNMQKRQLTKTLGA